MKYKIYNLNDVEDNYIFLEKDSNDREIKIYHLTDSTFLNGKTFYPDVLVLSKNKITNPIVEKIMSLDNINSNDTISHDLSYKDKIKQSGNYFFFIYNTDNYFHFIYDTIPYLISFIELKTKIPDLKLLMNYPNQQKKEFYRFVNETLIILGIVKEDIEIINDKTSYENLYISTSYTHDLDSNKPPREEVYELYNKIVKKDNNKLPEKIYVSRRSWLHNDTSNIGTNYTTRRKLVNEDELVRLLNENGFIEVFPELLSMGDKIELFYNAKIIVGAFGGGICNVLFSKPDTKLVAIASPYFIDVNKRFEFSFKHIEYSVFDETKNTEDSEFKTFMRVKYGDIVGEILEVGKDYLTISYLDSKVAGWNSEMNFKKMVVNKKGCIKLDNGLNSPWEMDLEKFKKEFLC